jgi:hypothetical protein
MVGPGNGAFPENCCDRQQLASSLLDAELRFQSMATPQKERIQFVQLNGHSTDPFDDLTIIAPEFGSSLLDAKLLNAILTVA